MNDRIQLSRAKGWRMPQNSVKVDRSTIWGNPWKVGNPGGLCLRTMGVIYHARLPIDQTMAVEAFRLWIKDEVAWWMIPPPDMFTTRGWENLWGELKFQRNLILGALPDLRGKSLACWCPLDQPCHADVLMELANEVPG